MVVVDSSVWTDFFADRPSQECQTLRALLQQGTTQLIVPDLVLFEVLRGFRGERELQQARRLFGEMTVEPISDAVLARRAAERWRRLREHGWTVRSSVDALVASYCIERELTLLHRDRDFGAYVEHFGLRSWVELKAS